MTSVEWRPFRGQSLRAFAMLALFALAACAGSTPEIAVTAVDASEPATASNGPAGRSASADAAAAAAAAAAADGPAATGPADMGTAAAEPAAEPPPTEPAAESEPPPQPATREVSETTAPAERPLSAEAATEGEPAPPAATGEAVEPAAPAAEPVAPLPVEEPSALAAAPAGGDGPGPPGSGLATGRPYVVIRFTEDAPDYEPTLAEAVRLAVARRPNVAFDLVAVTPRAGTAKDLEDDLAQARTQAAAVMQSLIDLGIEPDRVSMLSWTGQPTDVNEIRLYIR